MAQSDVASDAVLGWRVETVNVTEDCIQMGGERGGGQTLVDSKEVDQEASPLASDGEGPAEEMHPGCLSWRLARGQ